MEQSKFLKIWGYFPINSLKIQKNLEIFHVFVVHGSRGSQKYVRMFTFFVPYSFNSQTLLNHLMEDCHIGFITNIFEKKGPEPQFLIMKILKVQ
jgi:hypothetical protein